MKRFYSVLKSMVFILNNVISSNPCFDSYHQQDPGETALHFAVRTSDQTSLHLVDFLVQNRYQTEYCETCNRLTL